MNHQQLTLLERKVFDGRTQRLQQEFPHLTDQLTEVPCCRCFEELTCQKEQIQICTKLTAWLMSSGDF